MKCTIQFRKSIMFCLGSFYQPIIFFFYFWGHYMVDVNPSPISLTWPKKRESSQHITKRLYQFLINESFFLVLNAYHSSILKESHSNNLPISLDLSLPQDKPPYPLKFNPHWLTHEDFRELVTENMILFNCKDEGLAMNSL